MITNYKAVVESEADHGRRRSYHFVKNVNQVTTQGVWYDLTGSAGNPRAKQWFDAAPLTAAQIKQSTDGGIFHGGSTGSGKSVRFLRAACATATPLPMQLLLCDYLLYYPTIEDGTTDVQAMDNTLTLPRATTGEGVMMMAVTISARTGGQSFSVSYTNQAGVSGRTSATVVQNAVTSPGTITTSTTATAGTTPGPFIPLQEGDTGVRQVDSVTMNGADTGFFAIVLVKPIAATMIREIDAPYDKDFLIAEQALPQIEDDAYLSLLALPNGSLSGLAVRGTLNTIWG